MTQPTKADRRWVDATVVRIEHRTPHVVSLFVSADIPLYEASQHVDVRLTAPDGYQAQRSYSIASAPGAEQIELIVERLDDGEVSPYFHDVVQVGDVFEIRGPIGGHFVWTPEFAEPVLLVAAGSGAAPLISILRHRLNTGSVAPMLLLYSARTWEDVICRDELFAAEASDPDITVVLTITRGLSDRADDFSRRIDPPLIEEFLGNWRQSVGRVYVCGSNDFVDTATSALIDSDVAAEIIRTERYG